MIITVSIKWCLEQKNGLELVKPNENMSDSYLRMAEESISALKNVLNSNIWTATTSYYVFYYSLYSLMLRAGVKCEIHKCSLEFMKKYLESFYDKKDQEMIQKAFVVRINLQYYADRPVDKSAIEEIQRHCKNFFIKTKTVLSTITEEQIEEIRSKISKLKR